MKLAYYGLLGAMLAHIGQGAPRGQSQDSFARHSSSRKQLRNLQMDKDDSDDDKKPSSGGGSGSGSTGESEWAFGADECVICTPDNKTKPLRLLFKYYGGVGQISKYQTEDKADCRDQTFPTEGTVSAYGVDYPISDGAEFEVFAPDGKFDAATTFTFSNGVECFIHTSCSQPIVAGDRFGPFQILEGNECVYNPSYCGDGTVDEGEECDDGNNADGDGCRADCTLPKCGDGIVDTDMGEECDMNVPECREDCTLPKCGDGIVDSDMGEECDDGNTEDGDGCQADCKLCVCEASAMYDDATGSVTIDYEYCEVAPIRYDFIGIYPCDARTMVGNQEWWDSLCATQLAACGEISYGFEEGQTYVDRLPVWWTYTCGAPGVSNCQQDIAAVWPTSGSITIDPSVDGANWAFGEVGVDGSRALAPGCYKVLMNREIDYISAPPYPTICADWGGALEFQVS